MTYYHQRQGTQEQKEIFNKAEKRMDLLYKQYMNIYKKLNNSERNYLWNLYLQAQNKVKETFKPFGFTY